ncbi:hypothetical protein [Halorubrum sp. Atlit-26R]|uniref:hypothetical protein n=1 Tax=Halorubrum sp. Atlit-26R TaxID=2282128 RepID=UPI0011C4A410|nr:hypothetical protein [Halorubrum sp. Atlit-26R]
MASKQPAADGDNPDVTAEEARERLMEGYGNPDPQLRDLTELHDGILSFLAMRDQAVDLGDNGDELPDDLDSDTRRQLSTARTMLLRAKSSIEETAQERLNAQSTGRND